MEQYKVTGMSCAACSARVENAVRKVPGVTECSVSLLTGSMGVEGTASSGEIIRAVEEAGYGASVKGAGSAGGMSASEKLRMEEEALRDTETPKLRRRLIVSAVFLLALMYISMGHMMWHWPVPEALENHVLLGTVEMLLAIIIMLINGRFYTSGFKALFHGAPNMDTLVALGSSAAFVYSVAVLFEMILAMGNGDDAAVMRFAMNLYFESAAMIVTLITIGKMLEAMSKGRTTNALRDLMDLAPKTAVLVRDGKEQEVPIDEVACGEIFAVRPGESIPVDGVILEGVTAIDESALTGESIPVDKSAGDPVTAATINRSGYIRCRAVRVGEDTTLAQIIRMVSDAAATKAPIGRIADRVSGIFVPAVIGIALLTLAGWLIAGKDAGFAIARAISVLVISCPCALGLATPVAIMVGSGVGARSGILYKTAAALEGAGRTQIAVLDKTGTITRGEPVVTDILPAAGVTKEELLQKAGALEARSEHPLARAVTAKLQEEGEDAQYAVTDFLALPGSGLSAKLGDHVLTGGSSRFISSKGALPEEAAAQVRALSEEGKTPLLFMEDERLLGMIAVADTIREDSAQAVRELRGMGIHVVMLTGDNARTAKAIGEQAGVDTVIAGVLPEGKDEVIRALSACGKVTMVGDGINDAPALTRADTGIAIGAGTDVAVSAADIVLMKSRLTDASAAIRLSRRTISNIHENLFWAFFYNAICIPMAIGLFGFAMKPMYGAAAMSLSSFCVCMNALRLNLVDIHSARRDRPMKKGADKNKVKETAAMLQKSLAKEKEETKMTKTLKVEGMMCGHCEATVEAAVEAVPGVESAAADHNAGTVTVTFNGDVDLEQIKKAIEDKDYTVTGLA